jgi:hypothetical protein
MSNSRYSHVVLMGTGSVTEPWASELGAGYVTAPLVNALLEDLATLKSPQSARAGPGAIQGAQVHIEGRRENGLWSKKTEEMS